MTLVMESVDTALILKEQWDIEDGLEVGDSNFLFVWHLLFTSFFSISIMGFPMSISLYKMSFNPSTRDGFLFNLNSHLFFLHLVLTSYCIHPRHVKTHVFRLPFRNFRHCFKRHTPFPYYKEDGAPDQHFLKFSSSLNRSRFSLGICPHLPNRDGQSHHYFIFP